MQSLVDLTQDDGESDDDIGEPPLLHSTALIESFVPARVVPGLKLASKKSASSGRGHAGVQRRRVQLRTRGQGRRKGGEMGKKKGGAGVGMVGVGRSIRLEEEEGEGETREVLTEEEVRRRTEEEERSLYFCKEQKTLHLRLHHLRLKPDDLPSPSSTHHLSLRLSFKYSLPASRSSRAGTSIAAPVYIDDADGDRATIEVHSDDFELHCPHVPFFPVATVPTRSPTTSAIEVDEDSDLELSPQSSSVTLTSDFQTSVHYPTTSSDFRSARRVQLVVQVDLPSSKKLTTNYDLAVGGKFVVANSVVKPCEGGGGREIKCEWEVESRAVRGGLADAKGPRLRLFVEKALVGAERRLMEEVVEERRRLIEQFEGVRSDMSPPTFDNPPFPDDVKPLVPSTTHHRLPSFAKLNSSSPRRPPQPVLWKTSSSSSLVQPTHPSTPSPCFSFAGYDSIKQVPRGTFDVPGENDYLTAIPMLPSWEEEEKTRTMVENLRRFMVGVEMKKGEKEVRDLRKEKEAMTEAFDWDAFEPLDRGLIRRDFFVLKELVTATGITEEQYRLSVETRGQDEDLGMALSALSVFEKRVNEAAEDVVKRHGLISDEKLFDEQIGVSSSSSTSAWRDFRTKEQCSWCGDGACTVHNLNTKAYNVPTYPPRAPSGSRCDDCYKNVAPAKGKGKGKEVGTSFLDDEAKQVWAYRLQAGLLPPSLPFGAKPPKSKSKGQSRKFETMADVTLGYIPCNHPGYSCAPCTPSCEPETGCQKESHCKCIEQESMCDGFYKADACLPCLNSQLRLGETKRLLITISEQPNAGFGLVAGEDFKRGELVGIYAGELFSTTLSDLGYVRHILHGEPDQISYWFSMNRLDTLATDCRESGNQARFINTLNDEADRELYKYNCTAALNYVSGVEQMTIYATEDIRAGQELYLDYGEGYVEQDE
ncbi:hypothetical protein MNV49_007055 [Pseudohyphozyma bogoriensis]|nr:hypothetical protein MNV49_007055 [Pseudohyphozyma bogoriensis]